MYLDAGTNNEQYLHDPLYLGLRQTRPSTEELYSFVDEFVEAVQEAFPKCCIHFEDWTGTPARKLLICQAATGLTASAGSPSVFEVLRRSDRAAD